MIIHLGLLNLPFTSTRDTKLQRNILFIRIPERSRDFISYRIDERPLLFFTRSSSATKRIAQTNYLCNYLFLI